ncbi:MAG: VWA domain-containing protein [Terracidiphilus sp.]
MRCNARRFLIASVALFVCMPAVSRAQELPNGGTFSLTSRLVYVDVVVRDRNGQVVHGLTQQDFKVEEDGREQKIDFFEAHTFDQPVVVQNEQASVFAAPQFEYTNVAKRDAAAGAINIILFDLLNTPRTDLIDARKQLLKFLTNLPAGQNVALFVLTDRLHMVQNFSGSSDRLLAAAKSIQPDDRGIIRSQTEAMQDNDFISTFAKAIGGRDPGGTADKMKATLETQDAINKDYRAHLTIQALGELARATSGYPGRKNLLWLSESFPISLGAQLEDARFRSTPDLPEERETANLIASAQIAVYPISLLGMETGGVPASSSGAGEVSGIGGPTGTTLNPQIGDTMRDQFAGRAALRAELNNLADQTGGEAFVGTNDFAGALRRSMLDGCNYYTLAYRPSNGKWNGQFRKIHVQLVAKSGSLTYRRGYFAVPDAHPAADSAQELHFAMQPETPESTMLSLRSRVRLPDAQHPTVRVDSVLDPANAGFSTTADGKRHAQFLVLLIALNDGEQRVAAPPQTSGVLRLDLTPDQYKIAMTSGIPMHLELNLKPGKYRLRLGVSDMSTHDLGTLDMPVGVGTISSSGH